MTNEIEVNCLFFIFTRSKKGECNSLAALNIFDYKKTVFSYRRIKKSNHIKQYAKKIRNNKSDTKNTSNSY